MQPSFALQINRQYLDSVALIRKDFRWGRTLLAIGLILAVVPYVLLAIAYFQEGLWADLSPTQRFAEFLSVAGYFGVCTTQAGVLMTACTIVANERVDRSEDFLATLPCSRLTVILSKFSLVLFALTCSWLIHCPVILIGSRMGGGGILLGLPTFFAIFNISFCMCANGWLASIVSPLPAFAVLFALISPGIAGALFYALAWLFRVPSIQAYYLQFDTVFLLYGDACFLLGIIVFSRQSNRLHGAR